jgi:hypothetical protein
VAAANPAKSSSEFPAVIFGLLGPDPRGHLQACYDAFSTSVNLCSVSLGRKSTRCRAGTPPTVQSRSRQSHGGRKYREIELRIPGRNFWFLGPRSAGTLASVLRGIPCNCGSVYCVTGAQIHTLSRWNTAHCRIPSTTEPWRPQIPRNRAQNLRPSFLVFRPQLCGDTCKRVMTRSRHL